MNTDKRILLVDDDTDVLELTQELLGMAGYAVTSATSGQAALALLNAGKTFDALITDHSMPGMTGEDLARNARKLLPNLPCLLVTGFGDTVKLTMPLPVLRKPFRAAQLAAAVRNLIAEG